MKNNLKLSLMSGLYLTLILGIFAEFWRPGFIIFNIPLILFLALIYLLILLINTKDNLYKLDRIVLFFTSSCLFILALLRLQSDLNLFIMPIGFFGLITFYYLFK